MRRLVFGGSFNPIHNGHIQCSRAVAELAGYDRVVLMPAAQPPHKPDHATLAEAADRLAMCRLAVHGDALFEVSELEIQRAGKSYTFDTATALIAAGQGPVNWLIGADMLMNLPTWHRAVELLKLVNFVIIARPGWSLDWNSLPTEFRGLKNNVVVAPMRDVSSTEIRQRVAAGLSIDDLAPPAVCDYIRQHHLYASGS